MGKFTNKNYVLQFECGHYESESRTVIANEMLCTSCNKIQIIKRRMPIYHVKCIRCSHANYWGTSEMLARSYLGKHQGRNPEHDMQLWCAGELVQHFKVRTQQRLPVAPPY